jgi:hypothetical protein
MHRLRTPLLAAGILASLLNVAQGQQVRPSRAFAVLAMHVQIEDADLLRTPEGFRFYYSPQEIGASIALLNEANESAVSILVDTAAFREYVRLTLERQGTIESTVRWLAVGAVPTAPPSAEPRTVPVQVSLVPGRGTAWRAAIAPLKQPLAPGTYKLRVVVDGLTPVAWSDTGQPLKLPPATVVSVTIGDPQTPAERTAGYRQLGHAAKRRGQLDDAECTIWAISTWSGRNIAKQLTVSSASCQVLLMESASSLKCSLKRTSVSETEVTPCAC